MRHGVRVANPFAARITVLHRSNVLLQQRRGISTALASSVSSSTTATQTRGVHGKAHLRHKDTDHKVPTLTSSTVPIHASSEVLSTPLPQSEHPSETATTSKGNCKHRHPPSAGLQVDAQSAGLQVEGSSAEKNEIKKTNTREGIGGDPLGGDVLEQKSAAASALAGVKTRGWHVSKLEAGRCQNS